MKIKLVNTSNGFLIPETDEDYDEKKRLKVGETYEAEIKLVRNPRFHRLFFKMIDTAWKFLPERQQAIYRNKEGFRQTVEVTAGYYDTYFSPKEFTWVQIPRSIAYGNMEQKDFEKLYMDVRNVLDQIITRFITQEEFDKYFMKF